MSGAIFVLVFQKSEEDKRERNTEIRRREAERRRRHEEMAKDSKKSFFELDQEDPYKSPSHVATIKSEVKTPDHHASDKEEGELDATVVVGSVEVVTDRKERKFLDMDNALDYEDVGSEPEESETVSGTKKTNKSESMALALGVQVKATDLAAEKSNSTVVSKEKSRRDKPSEKVDVKVERSRNKERSVERTRNKERSVERKNRRDGGRRSTRSRSPQRRDTNGRNQRVERGGGRGDQRRRRSRSVDRKPRRSPDRRPRSRSRDRRRSISPRSRRHRSRSRSRSRSKDRRNRRVSRSRSKSARRGGDRDRKSKEATPPPAPKISSSVPDDKERLNKEKMMKRAEALLLLKDHMRKEIEEQKRLAELKAREPPAAGPGKTDSELAMLEKLKSDTLDKLRKQEEIKQLAAVKKVLEVVAAGVKNAHKKKRDASSSSSSSSEGDRQGSRSERRKRGRKYSSSD